MAMEREGVVGKARGMALELSFAAVGIRIHPRLLGKRVACPELCFGMTKLAETVASPGRLHGSSQMPRR